MKNRILVIFILVSLYSCTNGNFKIEYHPDGNIKLKTELNDQGIPEGTHEEYYKNGNLKKSAKYQSGMISDTVFYYYDSGSIKEKGKLENGKKIDWWFYYDLSGKLSKKIEYLNVDNNPYENQIVVFDKNRSIDYSESSFFSLNIDDTIKIGKNIGTLDYFSDSRDFDLRFIYIYIENEYSNGLIKNDTFTDDINKLWFGVHANRTGVLKIKGTIQEELAKEKFVNGNSEGLDVTIKEKYFEKEVYVTDN